MKQQICFYVHTEYHLLLSLYEIFQKFSDINLYEVTLLLNRTENSRRLNQNLNLSDLPYNVSELNINLNLNKKLSPTEKKNLDEVLERKFDEFVFFQEQDPIASVIISKFKKGNAKIHLFQDGLKPYIAHTMNFSPSLYLNNIKQNNWIAKNGYKVPNYFSFIHCKMYGFLKGIDKLFITFPESYINWNKLPIEKIQPVISSEFLKTVNKIFNWEERLLQKKERVIFFMNQPMHDDGSFEVNLLKTLQNKYPEATIYIKNHPLTPQIKIDAYKQIGNVCIIDSKIPAELFIAQLNDSIVLSICSTSMFIDNPTCKFYYTFEIEEKNNIKRLKKYKVINPTSHVNSVKNIDEIVF